ncbi:BglG family transcription antiterminator [Paenibacillus sp. GP183]|uniref:BglG family transcription antiterminator n=1 Tax=Paenibacillus sp. GP183 TaxID=1882751 RepID=UPI000898E1CF|nr:BglG family transcription antiterminator [Paenibacillus sp. GP183]SEC30291.1 mannitol operon transcriptional antiterminator [Paenibacillus sp. GP183]
MNISNRQRQLLELLINRKDEITAGEMAAEIKVSTRTVHRELSELENILATYGVILRKKSGTGMQMQASPQQLEDLKLNLLHNQTMVYTSDERKILLLCFLLEADEPLKLFTLAHDLHITVPTVSHDLDELEAWIAKSSLQLIRRRGFGVRLSGSEANKRKMIFQLVQMHVDESDLFGNVGDQPYQQVTVHLLAMVGKVNWMQVEQVLWQLGEQWLIELSESDYNDLLIRLSVAITRIRQGKWIEDHRHIDFFGEAATSSEQAIRMNTMVQQISKSLGLELPPTEAAYIAELLEGNNESDVNDLLPHDDLGLMEIVGQIIHYVEARIGITISEDRSLREGLFHHIKPALQRLAEGAQIRNPLLHQIRKDYELLFDLVRQGVDVIISHLSVPDEEIGYLVMHFGASLERMKQFPRVVRAIVVCTSGIGSSKLLAIRLGKELPQIKIIDFASWYEAARIPEDEYDLIISTVDLPLDAGQYIKMSPLMTKEETEKLRHFVQDITLKRSSTARPEASYGDHSLERLRSLKGFLDITLFLLDRFEVNYIESTSGGFDLQKTLQQVCEILGKAGFIKQISPVVEQLLEREQHGSQVIPDTHLALFHTRSEQIPMPMIALFKLDQPLILDEGYPAEVRQLLIMLGPRELSKESLEVLSEISALLLIPEMIRLFEQGTKAEIKQFISSELAGFFANKMETGRNRK